MRIGEEERGEVAAGKETKFLHNRGAGLVRKMERIRSHREEMEGGEGAPPCEKGGKK